MVDKILIVDDKDINREMLSAILEEDYCVMEAENGRVAIEIIEKNFEDLSVVLLDLLMPEVDGYEVLEIMNRRGYLEKLPVLVISTESASNVETKCFEAGVSDFIRKPFDNAKVRNRVKNIVNLYRYKNNLEEKVEQQTEKLRKQNNLLQKQAERLQKSNEQIIDILGTVVESRNLESGEHIQRVKEFTRILAYQMKDDYAEYNLSDEKIQLIVSASALHDVGKIAIPDNILLKPGKLTKEEFDIMKSHTTRGCQILEDIEDAWDENYAAASYEICRHHHERYDGRGYPDGLCGDEIPISAQIVSIADVYDALVSERVYKGAFTMEEAFKMIVSGDCGVFSPKLLDAFGKVRSKFEDLANRNKNKKSADIA